MARNTQKKVYFTIGIVRDSSTYRALLADMARTGKSAPSLLEVRVGDYYAGTSMPAAAATGIAEVQTTTDEQAAANAANALDEWV